MHYEVQVRPTEDGMWQAGLTNGQGPVVVAPEPESAYWGCCVAFKAHLRLRAQWDVMSRYECAGQSEPTFSMKCLIPQCA
jgi:hypothetical protein